MPKLRGRAPPPVPPKKPQRSRAARSGGEREVEPLAEVERALSVLDGRHPEHVRAERQTREGIEKRRAETEAAAATATVEERRRVVRRIIAGVLALLVVGAAGSLWRAQRTRATLAEAGLAPLVAPYLAHGFVPMPSSWLGGADRASVRVDEPTCFVAIAGPHGRVIAEHGTVSLSSDTSLAFCTCAAETVTASAPAGAEAAGVKLLALPARAVGGNLALPFIEPRPAVLADPDDCSNEQLDAWLAAHPPTEPAATDWSNADSRARSLAADGFTLVAGAPPNEPFAVLPDLNESCWVAVSDVNGDALSLRFSGDVRPIVHVVGPIAWCARNAGPATVWREGKGSLYVLRETAAQLGGTLGLREAASRAALGSVDTWIAASDLDWDATSCLHAVGIAPPEITIATDNRPVSVARLAALSIAAGSIAPDPNDPSVYACAPPLKAGAGAAICVESKPLSWRLIGGVGKGAVGLAPLPFWMQAFASTADPDALKTELALVRLGRRLTARGFEPTVLAGVTEVEGGVEVVGRSGDDAVVAVGMAPEWPWAFCYTDTAAWKLDGEPHVIPLAAGVHVRLTSVPRPTAPRETRRTVVFRRSSKAS